MLEGLKRIAVLVCISVIGWTVYDYSATKKQNIELLVSNAALEESNKSVSTLLHKMDELNDKVDASLKRTAEQTERLDAVSRYVKRIGTEARKHDATYRAFVSTPIHNTSLRMFDQARNSDTVQEPNAAEHTVKPVDGHSSSPGVEARR